MPFLSPSFLSYEQQQAVAAIENGNNVFVTGCAGVGKSHLLQYLKRNYLSSGLHITASTGIAAVHIGGQTLHSWAGIGLGNLPLEQLIKNLFSYKFSRLRRKIKNAKMLAIDEISMIPAALFDLLNNLFKAVREDERAFGGLQMILFGDFLQLPPVNKENNFSANYQFCFHSAGWKELNLKYFIFQTIFRQTEQNFIKLLNNIRLGKIDEEDIKLLESRCNLEDDISMIKPTILVTHNSQVESINNSELAKIPHQTQSFTADFSGNDEKVNFLRKNCLANEILELKIGAQVMMLKNTYQKEGIINGSLGIVRDFSAKKTYPIVEFQNGKIITIVKEGWNLEKFDHEKREVVIEATITQIPLLLAWAITIHKSQGMSLDKIRCDLSRVFSDGQIYVALSRVKTINGLYINGIDFKKIRANNQVVEFYRNLI